MKLFYDTEFTGLHQNTTLISIGIVSENGHTFYGEFSDYDKNQCDDWIKENVLSKCGNKKDNSGYINRSIQCISIGNKVHIRHDLVCWLEQFDNIEMWSDCLAYDWVLFCELFDGAFGIPKHIYYIPFDICTLFKIKGINPDVSRELFAGITISEKHNALYDACVIKDCYYKLMM